MSHQHPKIIINDNGTVLESSYQSETVGVDQGVNHYVEFQWPWHTWPCCAGSGLEQTMEIEMNGQKIIIKGKDLKIKVEEVE